MNRLLVVSFLNVIGSPNSRAHHLIRLLAAHFDETFAISRNDVSGKSFWARLETLFRIRTEVHNEGNIHWIDMTHWGRIRPGLGHFWTGEVNPYSSTVSRGRNFIKRMLNVSGLLFELGILPSLIVVYVLRIHRRVNVFIGEGPWEGMLGILLKKCGLVRFVVYDDVDYVPGFNPIPGLRKNVLIRAEKIAVKGADLVFSVGERLASLRRNQGAEQVYVVPNGVKLDVFNKAAIARKKEGRPPTIIYTGYLGAWAGLDLAMQATIFAADRIPGLRLILLGHGSLEELSAVRNKIRELGAEHLVELREEVAYDTLPLHLAEADIGWAISQPIELRRYAFPLKVVEYMAAGLIILATEDTEASDLVELADAGKSVPYNVSAVTEAILQILENKEKIKHYKNNARAFSRRYDWNILIDNAHRMIKDHLVEAPEK